MKTLQKIPVVILNGFLGSGKTTLFRSLLSQSKKQNIPVCAIVNDMSELDVDGELLSNTTVVEHDSNILESISSCVLSSKKGIEKLDQAIQKLLMNTSPKLIIIETSGSCHPMPLVQYFKNHKLVQLTGVLVLVDSLMLVDDFNNGESLIPKMQKNMAEGKRDLVNLLVEQIMFCNHLFLTKVDKVEKDKLTYLSTFIQKINPLVSVHSLLFGNLSITSLLALEVYNYSSVAQLEKELAPILDTEQHTEKPYNLEISIIKDDRPFHPQRLWNVCHQYLDKQIYRSKGFFWLASRNKHSLLWQQVAGSISLELIGSWRAGIIEDKKNHLTAFETAQLKEHIAKETGRFGDRHCELTIIGDKTQVAQFTEKLKACFLTDEEIELWKTSHSFEDPWPKEMARLIN